MNKILVTLLALIGGSCISFAQMETGRVSDTAEDTLRIENEIVAVDTGFYQSVVRYDTVRYNLKMQSVYKKAFQLKNDVFVEKMKEPWLDDILRNRLCKLNCVMLYSHSISSVGERPAPRGGTTRPDECKITTI